MDSRMSIPRVAETGDIFYWLGGNEVIARALAIGSKSSSRSATCCISVCTLIAATRVPLIGESPLAAAAADIGVNDAIAQQQTQFYMNQARPSAVLSTDL